MKKLLIMAGALAMAVSFTSLDASAQGRGGGHGGGMGGGMSGGASSASGMRGLDRADYAAGVHGSQGRAIARTRGSHARAFCPPGQRKKVGLGSRFRC